MDSSKAWIKLIYEEQNICCHTSIERGWMLFLENANISATCIHLELQGKL